MFNGKRNLIKNNLDMNTAVPDCLVTNYEEFIVSIELPDLDDRHILAAAIKCQADVLVTNNLRDFSKHILERYGIDAQSPDVSSVTYSI